MRGRKTVEALPETAGRVRSRSALARVRARLARASMANCHLCAHHCGVNRLQNERGLCQAGAAGRVFSAQTEVADELELIPTFAIALSGCDLRCDFCITGAQSWNPRAGDILDPEELARAAAAALRSGARTVMFLGGEPSVHLPTALEIMAALPDDARCVWKTNAHGSAEARALLAGLFEVWLADYKFGNDECAQRLAKVAQYNRVVQENLLWAKQYSELIVRHLLMPGHVSCCWEPVAQWLSANLPSVKVSLRAGFWPAWHSGRHPEFQAGITPSEKARALEIARHYRLDLVK